MGRLTSAQCFDLILSLPARALIVGFAFLYDVTKILEDLPDDKIGSLVREETRQKKISTAKGPRIIYTPIYWGKYVLNFMNRRLTVGLWRVNPKTQKRETYKQRSVWDIFRFYQSRFIDALIDWKVADKQRLERMAEMKDKRGEFDRLETKEIESYCQEECAYLAKLARALLDAHEQAGLKLRTYYGAGSTASVFLTRIGAKKLRGEIPKAMRQPVASAFFGGRFENSFTGAVTDRCFNYDISSAYPYQATFLPCLLCGTWKHVVSPKASTLARSTLALIKWTIPEIIRSAWGLLPVRAKEGTIAFPLAGRGGWTWKDEFLAAQRLNRHVTATEAWIYTTKCDHQPFKDVPSYYLERCRLGKDGPGIVLKLGTNSIYGKLAQSKGVNPPFQSWVWAGNITSGTRAQLLDGIAAASDPANILMFATDGIWSTEELDLPKPRPTGTESTGKPLGGWECKTFDKGMFCVRPGIYFPNEPTEEQLKAVRARGLGKKTLYEQWPKFVDAWEHKRPTVKVGSMTRFVGAKSGISHGEKSGWKRSPNYGDWVEHEIEVSFSPLPKRQKIEPDGTLRPWGYFDWESEPYDPALRSSEATVLGLTEELIEEQPDVQFSTE
jgi:hypothetical protein